MIAWAVAGMAVAAEPMESEALRELAVLGAPSEVVGEPDETGIGRYRAVLFAAQDYGARSGIPDLDTPNRDVEQLGRVLRERYGFEVDIVRQATRSAIISRLDRLVAETTEDDAVIVYYAGHGVDRPDERRAYWLPVDAERDVTANWVSHDDVHAKVRSMKARHVMLLVDSCFSGRFRSLDRDLRRQPDPLDSWRQMRRLTERTSRLVITSGSNEPVSDSGRDGMSVFAYYLRQHLDRAAARYVQPEILFHSVKARVMEHAPQAPTMSRLENTFDEGGSLVLLNTSSCGWETLQEVTDLEEQARRAWTRDVGVAKDASPEALERWMSTWGEPRTVELCGEEVEVLLSQGLASEARGVLRSLGHSASVDEAPRSRRVQGGLVGIGSGLAVAGGVLVGGTALWWDRNRGEFTVDDSGIAAPDDVSRDAFVRNRTLNQIGYGALAAGLVTIGLGSTVFARPSEAGGVSVSWTHSW